MSSSEQRLGAVEGSTMNRIQRSKAGTIVAGVLSVILGIFFFMNPQGSTAFIVTTIGWMLVIAGAASLISAFTRITVIFMQADLYAGILELLFGILMVQMPGFFVMWVFVLLGAMVMVMGFNTLAASNAAGLLGVNATGGRVWSILMIVLGLLVMLSPFAASDLAMTVAGVALVVAGAEHVVEGVKMD